MQHRIGLTEGLRIGVFGLGALILSGAAASCRNAANDARESAAGAPAALGSAQEQAAPSKASPEACSSCEQAGECAAFTDCAKVDGTSPAGVARRKLCEDTLACLQRTGCAKRQAVDCYCGESMFDECNTGKGTGACKAEIERGLETSDAPTVLARFLDTSYGAGLANRRLDCQGFSCRAQCLP